MCDDQTTIKNPGQLAPVEVQRMRLVVVEGPGLGRDVLILDRPIIVGRGTSADLRIDDSGVSRKHAQFHRRGSRIEVRDLTSSNGTFVDGTQVEVAYVEPGSVVKVGPTSLGLEAEVLTLGGRAEGPLLPGVFGRSRRMTELAATIRKAAPATPPVLLLGESGTGKEGLAKALHDLGGAPDRPFEIVDCTLLSGDHLRSELFGHTRGAFTGATRDHEGAFARADGGTLFLDEVGELSPELQGQLLRVLESGEIRPLGAPRSRRVEVRVLSATHRDLRAQVHAGTFRDDLFYRLSALTVEVPPLRLRGEDCVLLARHFLPAERRLGADACHALRSYTWPGNVRELKNVLQQAVILCEAPVLRATDLRLPEVASSPVARPTAPQESLENLEARAIQAALTASRGNRTQAAERLGIARSTLYAKIRKFGLD